MKVRAALVLGGLALLASYPANAQSVVRGAREGAIVGNKAAGPVGAAVGTVMGATAYGFRSAAATVLGIPEETGSVQPSRAHTKAHTRAHTKKRVVHH
jgi:uncharacterized protein YcfJ